VIAMIQIVPLITRIDAKEFKKSITKLLV